MFSETSSKKRWKEIEIRLKRINEDEKLEKWNLRKQNTR